MKTSAQLGILCCITFLVFFTGLSGDFVFDDIFNIVNNSFITSNNSSLYEHVKPAVLSSDAGPLKRPISLASFALNTYFTHLNPYYLKLTNLFIHLFNGLLAYFISLKILAKLQTTSSSKTLALAISATFLLHPLSITSVLYVVQRMTSLSAFFCLSGILLYITTRENKSRWEYWSILIGIPFFTILAALSKENGLLLPYYCLLIEIVFFQFLNSSGKKDPVILSLSALIIILTVSVIIYLCIYPDWLLNGYTSRTFTLSERILTESRILLFYLRLILLPNISLMGLYHDDIQTSVSLFLPWTTALSIFCIMLLVLIASVYYKKSPVFCFGVFFFFIGHSMESSIFPLELAHEHRNYLPMLGPVFILLFYLDKITARLNQYIKLFFAVTFFIMLSISTSIRANNWGALISHTLSEVANHPKSHRANYEAGRVFQKVAASGKYDRDKAHTISFDYFKKAQQLKPNDAATLLSFIHTHYIIERKPSEALYKRLFILLNTTPIHSATFNIISAFTQCTIAKKCTPTKTQLNEIYNQTLYNPKVTGKGKASVLISAARYFSSIDNYVTSIGYLHLATKNYDSFSSHFILSKALLELDLFADAEKQLTIIKNKDYYFIHKQKIDRLYSILNKKRAEHTATHESRHTTGINH